MPLEVAILQTACAHVPKCPTHDFLKLTTIRRGGEYLARLYRGFRCVIESGIRAQPAEFFGKCQHEPKCSVFEYTVQLFRDPHIPSFATDSGDNPLGIPETGAGAAYCCRQKRLVAAYRDLVVCAADLSTGVRSAADAGADPDKEQQHVSPKSASNTLAKMAAVVVGLALKLLTEEDGEERGKILNGMIEACQHGMNLVVLWGQGAGLDLWPVVEAVTDQVNGVAGGVWAEQIAATSDPVRSLGQSVLAVRAAAEDASGRALATLPIPSADRPYVAAIVTAAATARVAAAFAMEIDKRLG